jgi:hypothetical protein
MYLEEVRNTIKMKLKETGHEAVDWIHLAHDREKRWAARNNVLKFRLA